MIKKLIFPLIMSIFFSTSSCLAYIPSEDMSFGKISIDSPRSYVIAEYGNPEYTKGNTDYYQKGFEVSYYTTNGKYYVSHIGIKSPYINNRQNITVGISMYAVFSAFGKPDLLPIHQPRLGQTVYLCVYKTNRETDPPIDMFITWKNNSVVKISVNKSNVYEN